jgi:drug/metabolite transporter (DMT)-like permease
MSSTRKVKLIAVGVTLFGIFWLSPDSVLVRLYSCDVQTQLMYKNVFFSLFVIPFVALEKGGWRKGWVAAKETGYYVIPQGGLFTLTQYCFTYSITNTAAATTLVLLASSPLFSSFWSRILLGEELKWSTMGAMVGGAVGIVIVFVGNLTMLAEVDTNQRNTTATPSSSSSSSTTTTTSAMDHPLGIALGLCTAMSVALYFVLNRHVSTVRPKSSQIVSLCVVGPACVVIGLLSGAWHITSMDLLWAFVQGGIVGPVAFGALAIAPKYLLASEVGLLQLLETIVGPIWVYVGGYEVPPLETVYGGVVLLLTLAVYFTYELTGKGGGDDGGGGGVGGGGGGANKPDNENKQGNGTEKEKEIEVCLP